MDLQAIADSMTCMTSIYAFDVMPDGSKSELYVMAANKMQLATMQRRPDRPKFYPGIPWRQYFTDVNMENFIYKCGMECVPLYSYVNAYQTWLKGFYLPILTGEPEPEPGAPKRYYVLYLLEISKEMDTNAMSNRSAQSSAAVINISMKLQNSDDYIKSISETIRELRLVCGSELCSLITVDSEKKQCKFINEDGEQPELIDLIAKEMGCSDPYEVALAWQKDLSGSDCLMLDELSMLKERDPAWYQSLVKFKIDSIVLYSVRFNLQTVGFIWAANFDKSKLYHIKETLELASFMIGGSVANHQLLERLKQKSSIDELTKLSSRNLMDERIDAHISGKRRYPDRLGIVFADLNGLKRVNDTQGHAAGDKLLFRAASLLKLAFGDHEIYRAGGDEFVAICPEITAEDLERQTAQLRALADASDDVSFAIGTVCCEGDYDIEEQMRTADKRMYADKVEYYKNHPDKDRRNRK